MKQRIVTGLIGGSIFLAILFLGGIYFHLSMFILAMVGIWEITRMRNAHLFSPAHVFSLLLLIALFGQNVFAYNMLNGAGIIGAILLAMVIPVFTRNQTSFDEMAVAFLGALYIGIGFYTLVLVRDEWGFLSTLMVLLTVWATDSGAYFTGSLFKGRGPKLWESISPKKTVIGAIGGTLLAVAIVIVLGPYTVAHLSISQQILLGIAISVIGQIGDLAESAYKRTYNVKDSGTILPGHGGILDRFDSIIFVFPAVYVLFLYI